MEVVGILITTIVSPLILLKAWTQRKQINKQNTYIKTLERKLGKC